MSKRKLEAAKKAINDLFSDTSVSKETTLDDLEDLQSDIELHIDAIRADIKREQG